MIVAWVRPDVAGIDRSFAYRVPDALAASIVVGTIVRVELHHRRVRGWVVRFGSDAPVSDLAPLLEVVSMGPPPEVVALAEWTGHRYVGNPVALLRVASPPNIVAARPTAVMAVPGPGFVVEVAAIAPTEDRRPFLVKHLAPHGSTLVLVPPSASMGVLADAARQAGHGVAHLTGAQSDAERTAGWRRAAQGNCVVIGGRIAAFAPVPDLAAVVIFDEGDEAFVEERMPTWNARTVAVERAQRAAVPITLVSPAPSLDARALSPTVQRPERSVERAHWPRLEVVDRSSEEHRVGILTVPLAAACHRALDRNTRVVMVVNRKGRVRCYACANCRSIARCEACGAAVVEAESGLQCPRCLTERPRVCAQCFGSTLRVVRAGVTRLADDVRALLPNAVVCDIDSDTTQVPDADVYIGTEAALHRAPREAPIGLVALLDFDQELLAPRVRASEQALWLCIRSARRLGARARNGVLLVQTSMPEHPVVQAVAQADPLLVADYERPAREAMGFPPFGGLAALRGSVEAVKHCCAALTEAGVRVLGPTTHGDQTVALVHGRDSEVVADALAEILPGARALGKLRIEVDPLRV